jgi:hypothetical protein
MSSNGARPMISAVGCSSPNGMDSTIPTASTLQGFCCTCSGGQVWQESVGSAKQRTRAGLNCDWFQNPYLPVLGSPPGSAHCLLYQAEWCALATASPWLCSRFRTFCVA